MASDNKREQQIAALQAGDVKARKDAALWLGRASQRDYGTESAELLRGVSGTKQRDTGATLLRASDKGAASTEKSSLLGRLRRWLGQEG